MTDSTMQNILAIDTATHNLHLGLQYGGDRLIKSTNPLAKSHGQVIFKKIEELFESADLTPSDLHAIVVSIGPGSFTGLRIGLAAAKGIAVAAELPILGVQLFDLAASPWLLVRMLKQAREGLYPQSRTAVLQNLVEDAIIEVPPEDGMRTRAEETLYALAWEMHSTRNNTWPLSDAFNIISAMRGSLEYSMGDFYKTMVKCGLLAQVGQEATRFAYPAIQAYCCAKAILSMSERDEVLDDITATLGRPTRLRWWEDVLILLSS